MKEVIWLGIFTLTFLLLEIYCIYKIVDYFKLKKNGICCYAKITRLEKEVNRNHTSYRPWIKYKTSDNIEIEAICGSAMSIKSKKYSVGKSIKIYYNKENPLKYVIDKNSLYINIGVTFFATLFLAGMSVIFLDLLFDMLKK